MTLKNFLFQGDYGTVATPSKEAFARWLNENDGQNDNETSQPKVGADLLFVGCIVCTVGSCYIYCMWHMFRRWWCPGRADITADITVLDHDGVKFNLDPTQRRAALEAIFSEASKVSSIYDQCVVKIGDSTTTEIELSVESSLRTRPEWLLLRSKQDRIVQS